MDKQEMKLALESYKLKVRQKVSDLDGELQSLKLKAREVGAEQKQNYRQTIDELETKRDRLTAKLNDLSSSSESAFDELKTGVENAWSELLSAFEKAKASF